MEFLHLSYVGRGFYDGRVWGIVYDDWIFDYGSFNFSGLLVSDIVFFFLWVGLLMRFFGV